MKFVCHKSKLQFTALLLLAVLSLPLPITSQSRAETIGVSIPLSGPFAELGRKFRTGANLAMSRLTNGEHKLFIADDGCDPDLARLAAADLKSQSTGIITGFLCNEAAIISANAFSESKIPLLIAGARSVRLIKDREREGWNLWRMSQGDDAPAKIALDAITDLWRSEPYAIIDDGTIYGRNFTDSMQIQLENAGLAPQFTDAFRAAQSTQAGLLRRLQGSGVTAALIAASTTEDLFTIALDNSRLGLNLKLIATEALGVLPFLEEADSINPGIMVIVEKPFFDEDIETYLKEKEILSDPQIYMGYAAIEVALASLGETPSATTENLGLKTFSTTIGQVNFDETGNNSENTYEVRRWNGQELVPITESSLTQ